MANCCSWFRRWRKPKRYVKQNTFIHPGEFSE
ncbi:unnamed protein product [Tetraodon nigroviridis]|uniref:(spotted green pufferfish) hypothetical protein n=1 Tax=Tetraodon nigroviridis TaxID=99883 RepID=Q4SME2_TETNG|nr:unnamed protein product [Tetraodon nigroviridis]